MSLPLAQHAAYPGLLVPGLTYPSEPLTPIEYQASQSLFVDNRNKRWRQDKEATVLFWKNIKGDF